MGHDHGHAAGRAEDRARLRIVLAVTACVLVLEVVGWLVTGSLALLADAGHMLTDVAGLSLALVAAVLAGRPATQDRTWGYRRAEVLAAAAQAAVLLAVGGFILAEAIRRLIEPSPVTSGAMVVFGVVGLAGNAVSIVLLSKISGGNLNTRAARLEVVNDALGSVDVLMEATPKGVDLAHVRAHILDVPHVHAVHDLHASSVASDLPVLTAHVVVDDSCFRDGHLPQLLDQLQQCLAGHFDVDHSTVQFEPASHAAHEHLAHA